ncbi:hypothetical protein ABPG73_018333 [Tetrahymena malaccensis]
MNKILITFTILNLLLLVVSQDYISSNSSQSGTIEFARYQNNSPCSKANETIKSQNFQFQFQNTPQVLIGIVFFDLDTTKYTIAFNFTIQSVDKKQTSIQLNRYGDTCIWGIGITYFAVDDDDIKIQSYTLYFNSSNDISDQNKKQYQFAIQQAEKKRDVQCAISGFNSTYLIPPSNDITYSHRNFQLTTQVDSTNNFYFIQMQAPDLAVNLKIIYVNCIEYYIGQAGDYSMINNIQLQQSTQQITTSQNFQINLDSSFIGNSISSFLGLQQFDLTQSSALRIEYQNFNFQNNQFTFQVITWASSILYSSSILFFQHQMIDCKSSKSLINSNNLKQCVSSCPDGQYPASFQSTLVCSPCNSICKTCSSLNVCTSCQSNQFLDPSSQSCSNCDSNCLTCSSSSQQCLSCHQDYFLYNKTCQQDQPQGTYCDKSKTCQDCQKSYQCYYCQEKLQVCLKCIENLYFLNGVCSTQQPPNTYCIKNDNIDKYCQNCHPTCSQCFGQQLNQCLACQQGYQLVNSSCLCQQGYGYSTFSQQCEACKVNGCTQCSMNLNQCEICQTQFILDQKTGKCHCPNLQQYYSSEQQKCIQNQIQFCKISSLFENTCDQCLDGYYNYNKLLCSYCGKSKYTDSKNDCVNDCLPSCIICSNDSSCLLYQNDIDNNQTGNLPSDQKSMSIFNQGICDYSCGLCNGGGKTNCLICSSQSRIYDVQQQTCYCKSDSLDKGQAECQTPYDISQKIGGILQNIFIIFLVFQSVLSLFTYFRKANLNFCIIQQLIFIGYDQTLQISLNYTQIILSYIALSALSLPFVILTIYLKPFQSLQANIEIMVAELLISLCFTLHHFYSQDIFKNQDSIYLLLIVIAILLIQIFGIIQCFIQISVFIYQKLQSFKLKTPLVNSSQIELIPEFLQKDQIDQILSSKMFNYKIFKVKKSFKI